LIKLPPKFRLSERLTPAGITLLYAALAALWIVLSGYLLTLTVTDPLLQSRIELAKGLAFVAVTSGLLYLLLNHWRESHAMQPAQTELPAPPKIIRLVLILIALVLLVPLIGFVIYELNVPQIEKDAFNNLKSIAQLKSEEIENWLNERRGDAQGLIDDAGFARDVEHFLLAQKHDAGLLKQITAQLSSIRVDHGFDSIMLLDTGGRLITSLGKNVVISQPIRNLMHASFGSKQIERSDLYRDESGRIHMDWIVPLFVSDQHGKRPVAVIVLRAMPEKFLYPLIQNWPTASPSGETLLVRREGESVLFLNALRHSNDAPLTVYKSMNNLLLSGAVAIRENRPGTVFGQDYRQVPVLAAYRPIPGTDWYLIAKIDRDEVMMPLWNMLFWIGVIISVAVGLIIALLQLYLRQSQRLHHVALQARSADSLRENNELLRLFIEHAPVALAMFDRDMRYLAFSLRWITDYALDNQQLIGRSHYEVFPEIPARWKALHARALAGEELRCAEESFERMDGTVQWLKWEIWPWKTNDGDIGGILVFTEDISAHKLAEESLLKLSQAVEQSPSTIVITDLKANIEYANAAFAKESGYSLAEAIGKNPKLLHSGKTPKSTYDDMWAHLANGKPWEGEFINRRKDGTEYIESALISPVFQPDGRMTHFLAVKENITGRKAAEAKITRQTQLYAALSQCNEAIVRCGSEQELFPIICRDAVLFGGMTMAWIGLVDEASKQARPVASYGTGMEYLEGIRISVDADDPFGRGPAGTAIRENRPYWCQDFEHDPALAPWRERANKARWGAMAVLPLHRNGSPSGMLVLYSDTVNAFDDEARRLLTEMAIDISFALDNFAHEAERKQAVQELLDSEQRFRGLVEQSLAGIYIIQGGKLVYVNPRAAEIVGHGSADDLIGKDFMQFIADADQGNVAENMRKLLYKEVPNAALEFCVVHTEGHTISVGANASYAFYHGQPAVIGLLQDISEKKRDEERILKYVDQLKSTFLSTVQLATSLSEMRDPYTAGHERRVSEIAVAIATELGLDEQRIEGIKVAGYLHDIGKISIPSEILVKPGRLNPTEYALVQGHAQASYDVLKIVPFPWPVATIALQHHERMDGSGYPNKLKGDEILLESRIMAVADVVEAMASHRPYRPGLGIDTALAEIERGSGPLYDPVVAAACLRMFREQSFVLPPY